jgi:hypothetical protein
VKALPAGTRILDREPETSTRGGGGGREQFAPITSTKVKTGKWKCKRRAPVEIRYGGEAISKTSEVGTKNGKMREARGENRTSTHTMGSCPATSVLFVPCLFAKRPLCDSIHQPSPNPCLPQMRCCSVPQSGKHVRRRVWSYLVSLEVPS